MKQPKLNSSIWRGRLITVKVLPNGNAEYVARSRNGKLFGFTGDTQMQKKISGCDIGRWFTIDLRK